MYEEIKKNKIKKYILFGIDGDRWNMLSEISEEVPVSVVP